MVKNKTYISGNDVGNIRWGDPLLIGKIVTINKKLVSASKIINNTEYRYWELKDTNVVGFITGYSHKYSGFYGSATYYNNGEYEPPDYYNYRTCIKIHKTILVKIWPTCKDNFYPIEYVTLGGIAMHPSKKHIEEFKNNNLEAYKKYCKMLSENIKNIKRDKNGRFVK